MSNPIFDEIKNDIESNKIMLFIKGEKGAPQCGFSAAVLNVFDQMGVPYEAKNVLASDELRQGIKEFSNWPTIPQIYIGGKFVGGCDITIEMYKNGELQEVVKKTLEA